MSDLLQKMRTSSAFYGGNAPFIEELYELFLKEPSSVPEDWRTRFEQLPRVNGGDQPQTSHDAIREDFRRMGKEKSRHPGATALALSANAAAKQTSVLGADEVPVQYTLQLSNTL